MLLTGESGADFKASRVELRWFKGDAQVIAHMQRGHEFSTAMDDGKRNLAGRTIPRAWKHRCCVQPIALQALFPGLMTPSQELVEVHDAGCIGVAEAHIAFQFEPVVAVQNVASQL